MIPSVSQTSQPLDVTRMDNCLGSGLVGVQFAGISRHFQEGGAAAMGSWPVSNVSYKFSDSDMFAIRTQTVGLVSFRLGFSATGSAASPLYNGSAWLTLLTLDCPEASRGPSEGAYVGIALACLALFALALSMIHSWLKQREAERRARSEPSSDLAQVNNEEFYRRMTDDDFDASSATLAQGGQVLSEGKDTVLGSGSSLGSAAPRGLTNTLSAMPLRSAAASSP
ncbi:hypothetical protein HK105_202925 [Polyrhizophydium stewartii]|uniref:Uncharacterized protein n=1 Tax=Polyrhizophydium stewartii TaxID=2732419 RepID=A0ABR4NDN2_9FUNG